MTNERSLSEDDVRNEHMQAVHQGRQAAYLFVVILGSLLLMVGLLAFFLYF